MFLRYRQVAATAAVLSLSCSFANADTGDESYGRKIAIADGAAVSLVGIGLAHTFLSTPKSFTDTPGVGWYVLGGLTFLVASPTIHIRKGRFGFAAASLGLRLGLPTMAGIIVGASYADGDGGVESVGTILIGSAVLASAIDILFLSAQGTSTKATMFQFGTEF